MANEEKILHELQEIRLLLTHEEVGALHRLRKLEEIVCGNGKRGLAEQVRTLYTGISVTVTVVTVIINAAFRLWR